MSVQEKLFAKLKEYKDSLKNTQLTSETTFDDLGFDSLDKLEMLDAIETEYNISIDNPEDLKTMGELAAKIEELKK